VAAHSGLAHSAWTVAAAIVVPSLLLWVLSSRRLRALAARRYVRPASLAGRVLALALVMWMWFANFSHDGSSAPLPYLPFVNALDLGHILAGWRSLAWLLRMRDPDVGRSLPGAPIRDRDRRRTAFVWLNGILLRTIHHWAASRTSSMRWRARCWCRRRCRCSGRCSLRADAGGEAARQRVRGWSARC
jgi:hypothetical protein